MSLFSTVTQHPSSTLALCLTLICILGTLIYFAINRSSRVGKIAPLTKDGKVCQTTAKPSTSTDTDIVVVGAGAGGAALGAALAMRGHRVIVVEQSLEEPNRIVGELLQPSGCELLREMGLGGALEGFDAQRVYGYGIFSGKDHDLLSLEYPRNERGELHEGRSFHNGRFIMALRRELTNAGGELRQGSVTAMTHDSKGRVNGVTYRTRDGKIENVTGALTVVCDGLFSSFRSELVENTFQTRSKFLGLVLTNPKYPQPLGGNVFLADPTPILLYPISSTEARMLIDFPTDIPTDKEALKQLLLTHTIKQLPSSLHESFREAVEEGSSIKQMPNRQLCARPVRKAGALTLGDALNVRHPLTGGGMTVAFTDVSRIVSAFEKEIVDFNDHRSLDRLVSNHYATRSAPVAAINILADALYDVFGQKYGSLRAACYDYLSQGGEMAAGPIRLLSGVSRSQVLLVSHFFSVALWGVYRSCFPIPTPASIKKSFLMLRDANIIILPLLLQEHPGWFCSSLAALLRTIFWIPYNSYVFKQPKA